MSAGRCTEGMAGVLGHPLGCTLTHGHAGQHHDITTGAHWQSGWERQVSGAAPGWLYVILLVVSSINGVALAFTNDLVHGLLAIITLLFAREARHL